MTMREEIAGLTTVRFGGGVGLPYVRLDDVLAIIDRREAKAFGDLAPEFQGFDNAISHVRSRAGVIEENPVAD
jgi:hypothetical protein